MTRRKNNKRALTLSLLSLLLCMAMLVGSTFAWFTDNATTKVNTIQAGTLDIELLDGDGENAKSLEGETLTFAKAAGHEKEDVLFEPGAKYSLQQAWLYNAGNLHAKYKVVISGIDGNSELAKVLDVWVDGKNCGTLASLAAQSGVVKENTIAPKAFDTFGTIELMMQTEAGNEYQGKTLSGIAITVMATQAPVEYDSEGNQYDASAEYAPVAEKWDGTADEEIVPDQVPVVDENGNPVIDEETGEPMMKDETVHDEHHNREEAIIRIKTPEQLAALAVSVNNGEKDHYATYNVLLENDLDLANIAWTPIGVSKENPFAGNFDGQGHTIYNLKVSGHEEAGLFGHLRTGANQYGGDDPAVNYLAGISNLTIENVTITGATDAGAFVGNAKASTGNNWYAGVAQYENLTLKGDVKIEGTNVGGFMGGSWVDIRTNANHITVNVNEGSYVKGSEMAGGVFCSMPHGNDIKNITSNIDVIGEKAAGGIACNAAWVWENITCTGDVTLNAESAAKYQAGTMFGSIAYNTYWINSSAAQGLINGMTNLTATGNLTVNETDTNGCPDTMFGLSYQTGTADEKLFTYTENKVTLVTE